MSEETGFLASMNVEDIRNERTNLQYLVLQELDRYNFLVSVSQARRKTFDGRVAVARGAYSAIRTIESMLNSFLTEDYKTKSAKLKTKMHQKYVLEINGAKIRLRLLEQVQVNGQTFFFNDGVDQYLDLLSELQDLLISQFGAANLMPVKSKNFDFEE